MDTNSTNKLIEILERKQIKFEKGEKSLFRKYSYYQVVNAYKDLYDNICNKICEKYGQKLII